MQYRLGRELFWFAVNLNLEEHLFLLHGSKHVVSHQESFYPHCELFFGKINTFHTFSEFRGIISTACMATMTHSPLICVLCKIAYFLNQSNHFLLALRFFWGDS